jgi:hypothetical protein
MIRIYREALCIIAAGKPGREKQLQALKEQAKRYSWEEITAGHFLRGLKDA